MAESSSFPPPPSRPFGLQWATWTVIVAVLLLVIGLYLYLYAS